MTVFRLAAAELRRLTTGRLPTLALAAIALVPVLYGGVYLYANWDPYGRLGSVPAALVVDDHGVQGDDGKTLNVGERVQDRLIRSGTFGWQRTDDRTASQGVASGRYSFALVVPEDFSAALASPATSQPRQAQLRLITNDANDYLVSTIADRVASQVRQAVSAEVGTDAANRLLVGLSTVHDKTVEAAGGADQLASGADQLHQGTAAAGQGASVLASGAHRLLDGQHALLDGASRLADGTGRLASGADRLHGGLLQLQHQTAALPAQTAALADGAEKVAEGNERLAAQADVLGATSQQLVTTVDDARSRISAQLRQNGVDDATIQRVLNGLDQADQPLLRANDTVQDQVLPFRALASGSRQVADGARRLADATPALTGGVDQLTDGSGQVASGADTAATGAGQLRDGQQQAVDGAQALAGGADRLATGAAQLDAGSARLASGAGTLARSLAQGANQIPHPDDATRTSAARTIGDPVAVGTDAQATAGTYGAGLAPYFLGLALWIGSFVMFLLLRPLSNRALAAGVAPWRIAVGGWLPAAAIGGVQALLLYLVAVCGVGVHPADPWSTLGLLVLTALAFTAFVHALNAAFGARGKFLALVLLVLQLATAGGTFPWQTIPAPLYPLHDVLPLGYVVSGLRHLLYGGPDSDAVAHAVLVLLCYLAAGLVLATIAAARQHVWTVARLKPELSL